VTEVTSPSACTLDLADTDDATVLTIAAPEGGEAILHQLADLFFAGSGRAG
jgi:hypothetical protein